MKYLILTLLLANAHATTFLLVRHGETEWNRNKDWEGPSDISLNSNGVDQATKLRSLLQDRHFDLCFSSHLKRTRETAALLTNLEVKIDPRLQERSSKTLKHTPKKYEDPGLVRARVFECLEEIAHANPDKSILIVTHAGIIKQIIGDILSREFLKGELKVPNTGTVEITYSNGNWEINLSDSSLAFQIQ